MFVVTANLTIGQITFILRAAIQILSYGGLFLIGLLILGSAPRVASMKTYDILNRAVGQMTFTMSSLKWIWNYLLGRSADPVKSFHLPISIALLILYTVFISLSDFAFLGFYACSVPYPNSWDQPNSITTEEKARSFVLANLVNGTNASDVKTYRCESVSVLDLQNGQERICQSWQNSSWADPSFFANINTTDSESLTPRNLGHMKNSSGMNTWTTGPGTFRMTSPTLSNGIAIYPHDSGVQAVFGVPRLGVQQKVTLESAMALEIEMGCMSLGVTSVKTLDGDDLGLDVMWTNGTWREYTGPEYFRSILTNATDAARLYMRPLFNESSLDSEGGIYSNPLNASFAIFTLLPQIQSFFLPSVNDSGISDNVDAGNYILGNCTQDLRQQLNLTVLKSDTTANMCNFMTVGGQLSSDGVVLAGQNMHVCAIGSQVNLVRADIQVDERGSMSVDLLRLPSDLHTTVADFYKIEWSSVVNATEYLTYNPFERYTLSKNPDGATSHFIVQNQDYLSLARLSGAGSGGGPISMAGSMVLDAFDLAQHYPQMMILDQDSNPPSFNASVVTKWGGQAGASYIYASMAYNSYAALGNPPIQVKSTGGRIATCYHPPYALAFVPLLLAALYIIVWCIGRLFRSALVSSKHLEEVYGGMKPYEGALYTHLVTEDMLLVVEKNPHPHLEVVVPGMPLDYRESQSAQGYLRSPKKEKY